MSWSLVEVRSLSVKACRGAGYSWGLAEEAGYAVRWLSAHGLPGPAALAGLLQAIERGDIGADRACPITLGATLVDGALPGDAATGEWPVPGPVGYPLLLIPFLSKLSQDTDIIVKWNDTSISIANGLVAVSGEPDALLAPVGACTLQAKERTAGIAASRASRAPAEAAPHIETLRRFAARTYAPATEASRMAGAGAGTTDND